MQTEVAKFWTCQPILPSPAIESNKLSISIGFSTDWLAACVSLFVAQTTPHSIGAGFLRLRNILFAEGRRHGKPTCLMAMSVPDSSISRYGILIGGYWSPGLRYFERTWPGIVTNSGFIAWQLRSGCKRNLNSRTHTLSFSLSLYVCTSFESFPFFADLELGKAIVFSIFLHW